MQPNFKQPRVENKKHRVWVGSLPCLICKLWAHSQCAHIKNGCGTDSAPDDQTVPLCTVLVGRLGCHQIQHTMKEKDFWEMYGGIERGLEAAKRLYSVTGNTDSGLEIVMGF